MITDNLDALSDAQLSEVFAVEVAGWKRGKSNLGPRWYDAHGYCCDVEGRLLAPFFATSADAVLPFLTADGWAEGNLWSMKDGIPNHNPRWRVRVLARVNYIEGVATTFARAACLALIRAKRAQTP